MKRTIWIAAAIVAVTATAVAWAQMGSTSAYQGQNTGMYQMFFSPFARADAFLVNTGGGYIWTLMEDEAGARVFEDVTVEMRPEVKAPVPGRFRIYFGAHTRTETFLSDTTTGRLWQMMQDTETKALVFRPVTVQGIFGP